MKKMVYVFCALFVAFGCIFNTNIKASNVVTRVEFINPQVLAYIDTGNGVVHKSILGYIYANDKVVYCVEPYKFIDSNIVMVESSNLNSDQRKQISIVSYNGYNNSDRKSDRWYMATQFLIWETLGCNFRVEGFNEYPAYRQEILDRIANFEKLPSFNQQKVTLKKDESVILSDTNKIFQTFKNLVHEGNGLLSRDGNDLKLSTNSNKYVEGKVSFNKFNQDELGLPIVYRAGNDTSIQSIIYPQIENNVGGNITYRVQPYGQVDFLKKGNMLLDKKIVANEFGNEYQLQYGEGNLNDVSANVYAREDIYDVWGNLVYHKQDLVDSLVSNGKHISNKLVAGKYYLKEIKTLSGYLLDKKEYDFEILKDNENIDVIKMVLNNERARVKLNLTKKFEEGSLLDLSEAYKDVVYGIYTKEDIKRLDGTLVVPKNEMVYISNINEEGNLIKDLDLPLGSYYLKELATNEHFVVDEEVYPFEVKDTKSANIDIKINDGQIMNLLKRNHLKIYKTDEKGEIPLKAKFVLYDQNLKEIMEFETNEEGFYEFSDLVDGTYFIQEIEAPEGYRLNAKIHKITLNEDFEYTIKNVKHVVSASVETQDDSNHKGFEFSMLASMMVMYGFVFTKLGKI